MLLLLGLLAPPFAARCLGCGCRAIALEERYRLSALVFVGEVMRHAPLQETVFAVRERFKGRPPDVVWIRFGDSDCEYLVPPVAPRPGERYLIFASRRPGEDRGTAERLEVTRCLGSAPVAAAAQDLQSLRARSPGD